MEAPCKHNKKCLPRNVFELLLPEHHQSNGCVEMSLCTKFVTKMARLPTFPMCLEGSALDNLKSKRIWNKAKSPRDRSRCVTKLIGDQSHLIFIQRSLRLYNTLAMSSLSSEFSPQHSAPPFEKISQTASGYFLFPALFGRPSPGRWELALIWSFCHVNHTWVLLTSLVGLNQRLTPVTSAKLHRWVHILDQDVLDFEL